MDQRDQPCQDFKGRDSFYGTPMHQCLRCKDDNQFGLVSFCENCCRDHHMGGHTKCDHVGCPASCAEKYKQLLKAKSKAEK